jgi:pimeloyl-ACP methyl ester carboxylesterase
LNTRSLHFVSAHSLLLSLAARYGIRYEDASAPDARHIVASDGLPLHYLDWRGGGDCIVFLHGGALTAHTWDLACLGLRDRWRCLALDMRGHGESGWAEEYRIETAVEDVATLVAHNEVERIHLVGNSLGGMVAAHYAAAHPDRLGSLTLVDVGPNVNFAATQPIRDYIDRTDGSPDLATAIEHGLTVNPRIDREALEYRLRHSMRQREDQRLYWKQDRRRMHDYAYFLGKLADISRLAPSICMPALVVRGARSRVFSDEAAERCARLFPRGEWARIEESGHNVQESNPGDFTALLARFLSATARASATNK